MGFRGKWYNIYICIYVKNVAITGQGRKAQILILITEVKQSNPYFNCNCATLKAAAD